MLEKERAMSSVGDLCEHEVVAATSATTVANLTSANFSYSALRRAGMTGAELTSARFKGADMRGCIGCPARARAKR